MWYHSSFSAKGKNSAAGIALCFREALNIWRDISEKEF
jgi:hypothetical protein